MTGLFFTVAVLLGAAGTAGQEAWVEGISAPQFFAVRVSDVDRASTWYAEVFGLEILDDTTADDGRWRIVNAKNDRLFVEIIYDRRDGEGGRVRGFTKVGFRVPDVERVADRVEKATGERPRIVDLERHGVRILQLKDPEGNTVQLTSPL